MITGKITKNVNIDSKISVGKPKIRVKEISEAVHPIDSLFFKFFCKAHQGGKGHTRGMKCDVTSGLKRRGEIKGIITSRPFFKTQRKEQK